MRLVFNLREQVGALGGFDGVMMLDDMNMHGAAMKL
jgi:hypothetical protein